MQSVRLTIDRLLFAPRIRFNSEGDYRRALLTSLLGLLATVIIVAYMIVNLLIDQPGFWYGFLTAIMTASAIVLNRSGLRLLANILLILGSNIILFVFASSQPDGTGLQLYFVILTLGTLTLFDSRKWAVSLLLVLLTVFLFYLSYFTDFKTLPSLRMTDDGVRLMLVVSYATATGLTILFAYFLVSIHAPTAMPVFLENPSRYSRGDESYANRQRFELAAKAAKFGIYEWDVVKDEIYVSPSWLSILGYNEDDVAHFKFKNFQVLIHPEDQPKLKGNIKRHFESRKPYSNEFRMKTKSGYYKWILDVGTTQFDESGAPVKLVGSISDIDERRMAEQQIKLQNQLLEKANEELDRFVYSASHDLRAPLSSLLGLISIAELTDQHDEIVQCLHMMRQRVTTMEGFIREITDYSRNSRMAVKREPVALRDLLDDVLQNVRFIGGRDRITFDLQVEKEFSFTADASRVSIILNNLIANAIKYHDPHKAEPYVRISIAHENGHLLIHVHDNGMGIPDDHQPKIFNMFTAPPKTPKDRGSASTLPRSVPKRWVGAFQ
ncbi:MAG: PAS domain-containing protein [Bacteroidia bacterium]|nr:PAS domain-containing protein [Bacteroidia bacterium]